MNNLTKIIKKLPISKMSLRRKITLKGHLYLMMLEDSFDFSFSRKLQHQFVSFVLLVIFLFGLPFYSYASPKVNESNFLYPIKESMEKIELAIAKIEDKEAKYEKFSERRLQEAEEISTEIKNSKDREALNATMEKAIKLKDKAREASPSSLQDKPEKVKTENKNSLFRQKEMLNNIAALVGIAEDEKIIENIAVAMETVSSEKNKGKNISVNNLEEKTKEEIKSTREEESIKELEVSVFELKEELKDDYDEQDVKILFERLEKRVEDVNRASEDGSVKNIKGLINSTKAITNNAKQFIKKKERTKNSSGDNLNKDNSNRSKK